MAKRLDLVSKLLNKFRKLKMNFTQSIGNAVELKCILKFIEMGYEVSIPYGNGAKYDFIADVNGEMLRIQCKSSSAVKKNGVIDNNAFHFSTVSTTTNTQKTIRYIYDSSQIDYFATCWNDKVYLVPVDECSTNKTLRLAPPKGNTAYNKAEDYEIEKRISINQEFLKSKQEFELRNQSSFIEREHCYCIKCGIEITKETKTSMCSQCYANNTRVTERPSREELKSLIRTTPFTQIGQQFRVSDNAIRKWCDAEKLPRRSSDIKKYTDKEWELI